MNYWERKRANENWNEEKGIRGFSSWTLSKWNVDEDWSEQDWPSSSRSLVHRLSMMGLTQMQVRQCRFDWAFSHSIRSSRSWASMLKIDCKKHKIYCSSPRELPFSSRSWTLYLNLRSIASASRPDSHPYLLSRSRERAGADYDKEDGGRENKTGWSGLRPQIHQM